MSYVIKAVLSIPGVLDTVWSRFPFPSRTKNVTRQWSFCPG